jgi:predicted metal-dependent hydrolase
LEIEKSSQEGIRFAGKFIVAAVSTERASIVFKDWYIEKAKEKISPRVNLHARNLGVQYNKVMVSDLKYRWGSCTPKDNLNFKWGYKTTRAKT